jgi:hypothetical protein
MVISSESYFKPSIGLLDLLRLRLIFAILQLASTMQIFSAQARRISAFVPEGLPLDPVLRIIRGCAMGGFGGLLPKAVRSRPIAD